MWRSIVMILLCIPPIVQLGVIGTAIAYIRDFRRSFGAQSEIPVGAVVAGAVLLVLHMGYFLAPWLLHKNRTGLAMGLMTPGVLIGVVILGWVISRSNINVDSDALIRRGLVAVAALLVYFAPVALLLSVSSSTSTAANIAPATAP